MQNSVLVGKDKIISSGLDVLSSLAGIPLQLLDHKGNIVDGSSRSHFNDSIFSCLSRKYCDIARLSCTEKKILSIRDVYSLRHIAIPVENKDRETMSLTIGYFICDDDDEYEAIFLSKGISQSEYDKNSLMEAIKELPVLSGERVSEIVETCKIWFSELAQFKVINNKISSPEIILKHQEVEKIFNRPIELLEESEAIFEQIFSSSVNGMALIDKGFNIIRGNQPFFDLLNLPQAEIEGRKCYEVINCEHACFTQECIISRCLSLKKSLEFELDNVFDIPCIMTVTPLQNKMNKDVFGVVVDVKDISPLKKKEEYLNNCREKLEKAVEERTNALKLVNQKLQEEILKHKKLEKRMVSLQEVTRIGTWEWDVNKDKMSFSNEILDLMGRPENNCKFDYIIQIAVLEDRSKLKEFRKNIRLKGVVEPLEFKVALGDERQAFLRIDGSILNNFEGKSLRVIGTLQDITVQRRIEEELRRAEYTSKIKSEFLASMSHELRTPLNAIIGFSSLLKDGALGKINESQLDAVNTIFWSGNHLLTLVNNILDLSKIESGKMCLNNRVADVPNLLRNSIAVIRERVMLKKIDLSLKIAPQVNTAYLDETKIVQVLQNLLANAVKFTDEGGKISLIAEIENNGHTPFLVFKIKDTGCGISQDDFERLFEPFEQLSAPMTKKNEGTGLGLAISKKIIELHQGSIKVESVLGEGSCFTINIPLVNKTEKEEGK
jgi:PAS domain S-box-containing protein